MDIHISPIVYMADIIAVYAQQYSGMSQHLNSSVASLPATINHMWYTSKLISESISFV